MLTVLGIRHGAVEHPRDAYYGHLPHVGLSERGRAQAATVAEELKASLIHAIYASPLERAQQTAEILAAATGAEVHIDERLREWRFWEAIHGNSPEPPLPAEVRAVRATLLRNSADDSYGESLDQLQRRLTSWLDDVKQAHSGGIVVGVTHFDALRSLLAALLPGKGEHAWSVKIEHCQVLHLHPRTTADPWNAASTARLT